MKRFLITLALVGMATATASEASGAWIDLQAAHKASEDLTTQRCFQMFPPGPSGSGSMGGCTSSGVGKCERRTHRIALCPVEVNGQPQPSEVESCSWTDKWTRPKGSSELEYSEKKYQATRQCHSGVFDPGRLR